MSASKWTPERRQKQAETIRQQKPWLHATGPQTIAGKKKASQNAFKGAKRPKVRTVKKAFTAALREHKALLATLDEMRLVNKTFFAARKNDRELI